MMTISQALAKGLAGDHSELVARGAKIMNDKPGVFIDESAATEFAKALSTHVLWIESHGQATSETPKLRVLAELLFSASKITQDNVSGWTRGDSSDKAPVPLRKDAGTPGGPDLTPSTPVKQTLTTSEGEK